MNKTVFDEHKEEWRKNGKIKHANVLFGNF